MIKSELLSVRIFLVTVTLKNWQEKYYWKLIVKTNLQNYKIKDLNGENIIGSFYEKKLLLSKL